jgi:serine/threonine protein kinase
MKHQPTIDGTHRNAIQRGQMVLWYRIDAVLGQGGFGITYLAHDANLDEPVAIKEYLPMDLATRDRDCSVNPLSESHGEKYRDGMQRFIAEARTLSRFRHPNIVRVRSVFEANNTAYMVMDYEDGETLHQVVAREAPIPEVKLCAILDPILSGLEMVHHAGFVHRDIKPANIFIRRDGSPLLLDFGSARQAVGRQTRTLTTLISPGYAPIEQYFSKGRSQGPWTDIYALAATLYKAIAGRPPLSAVDRSECLLKSVPDCFVPISEIGAGHYSRPFLAAIDSALALRAGERPQSVADWRRMFEEQVGMNPAPAGSEFVGRTFLGLETKRGAGLACPGGNASPSVGPASAGRDAASEEPTLSPEIPGTKLSRPAPASHAVARVGRRVQDPVLSGAPECPVGSVFSGRPRWYALFHASAIVAALINLGLFVYVVKIAG